MSVKRIEDTKLATEVQNFNNSNIVEWEDIAIVIQETQYSTNDDSKSFESSYPQHPQHIENIKFGDGSNQQVKCDDGMVIHSTVSIPKSIPVGSSDDSCCSDSTESSGISVGSGIGTTGSCGSHNDTDIYDSINEISSTGDSSNQPTILEQNEARRDVTSSCGTQEMIRNESLHLKKKVKFTTVQVRDYAIVLGDHPYCDMYPLSLDWTYVDALTTTTDDFEEHHRRRLPNETRVFSPVVARKILKKGKGANNMVNVRARKLSVTERMSLLIEFTGCTSQQLYQLERKRQLMAQDEKLLYGINASLALT